MMCWTSEVPDKSSGAPDDVEGQMIQCPQHTMRLGGGQLRNCFCRPMERKLAVAVAGEGPFF